MARFQFPLEQALRYKERRERVAEMDRLRALAAKQACEAEVGALRRELDATADALLRDQPSLTAIVASLHKAELLAQLQASAEASTRQAEEELQKAIARHREAVKEAEMLRTLRHEQHQRFLDQVARAEQMSLEEQAMQRWQNDGP